MNNKDEKNEEQKPSNMMLEKLFNSRSIIISGVVLAKRGFYTLRQLLPKSLLSKHSELELILNSSNSKQHITSV